MTGPEFKQFLEKAFDSCRDEVALAHDGHVGDPKRAVADHYLRVTEQEVRGAWFGKRRHQFRNQYGD